MAINKIMDSFAAAVEGIKDGATVLVSGFGGAGMPTELLNALNDQGATDLTIVSNNAGVGREGIGGLLAKGKVRKVICSYPRSSHSKSTISTVMASIPLAWARAMAPLRSAGRREETASTT